ncbi:MAG: TonB-dependent receptor [Bacteroidetes bacterium]|nr:TonB-dependent receptor [Bacteroidota bacterium]
MKLNTLLFIACTFFTQALFSQTGELRGFLYDNENGETLPFTNVIVKERKQNAQTDINGFYNFNNLPIGKYTIVVYAIGYDSSIQEVEIKAGRITSKNIYMNVKAVELSDIEINADKQHKKTDPRVAVTKITPRELKLLPTVAGEPDLAQYLQVLPGVVFTGDQGGQLYIRGGSPVQNKVMLDGMIIYNPFHSIGLFSVFESDIIKNVDVYSAGFNAQYGGRVSAVIDVTSRDGNKKRLAGKVGVNTFSSKIILEGPLKKFKENSTSSSFLVSYKNSYLDKSSPIVYPYIKATLPYKFQDTYGKIAVNTDNGSKLNFFGFSFNDAVNYPGSTAFQWKSSGFGSNFLLVPDGSATVINGVFAYSQYGIKQTEIDSKPRSSNINNFNTALNFTSYHDKNEWKYGIEINGITTNFEIYNQANRRINEQQYTMELCGFVKYKFVSDKIVLEPGLRVMRYSSLAAQTLEPRFAMKYNISPRFRFKASGGYYSQNLMSAVSDKDVVNLFYGFLSGPDDVPKTFDGRTVKNALQKARHAVGGFEIDVNDHSDINIEGFIKHFDQITNINRDKIFDDNELNASRPANERIDYIVETGNASGFDVTYKYDNKHLYLWVVYSYVNVWRYDGIRKYLPHFDRRHTVNLVGSYKFGKKIKQDINARWSLGSGFPFTETQGFFEYLPFNDGVTSDYTHSNGQLGIIYADLNLGRLPWFHRMDVSYQMNLKFKNKNEMHITAGVTNIYNRENIFYFDRVNYKRVNQLPILPSVGITYQF